MRKNVLEKKDFITIGLKNLFALMSLKNNTQFLIYKFTTRLAIYFV